MSFYRLMKNDFESLIDRYMIGNPASRIGLSKDSGRGVGSCSLASTLIIELANLPILVCRGATYDAREFGERVFLEERRGSFTPSLHDGI